MRRAAVLGAAVTALVLTASAVAWAASLTVTSKHVGAAALTTPVMYPVSVTTTDVNSNPGRARPGDRITFVWSRQVDEPSLCSSWANTSSTQSLSMTWTAIDGTTTDDLLKPAATASCSGGLHVGTFDFGGSGYVSGGNATFSGSAVALTVGATTTTMTVTLGTLTGTTSTSSGAAGTWTPDPVATDRSAHSVGTNLAVTASTVMF